MRFLLDSLAMLDTASGNLQFIFQVECDDFRERVLYGCLPEINASNILMKPVDFKSK